MYKENFFVTFSLKSNNVLCKKILNNSVIVLMFRIQFKLNINFNVPKNLLNETTRKTALHTIYRAVIYYTILKLYSVRISYQNRQKNNFSMYKDNKYL